MLLSTFDIALRGASIALLLVLAASLFRDFRNVVTGRLAIAFALGAAAAFSRSVPSIAPSRRPPGSRRPNIAVSRPPLPDQFVIVITQ
jgi:hypothetical protein